PSVGEGCFYDLLPANKKIGIDIDPKRKDVIESDYLKYKLPDKPLIVIGNPPFGHRGVIALEFIKHSEEADFVCFILPMFFDSKGKGSIKHRVKRFNLIHSEELGENAFYTSKKADYYLSTTFYGENKVVNSFERVKYKSGVAIKINTLNREEIQKIKHLLENAD
ncbi:18512_t:CDS:2, partial [Gigaspora margarita]